MGRRAVFMWSLCAAIVAAPPDAEAQVLLGFIDGNARFAVQGAITGASVRLARPSCQRVLSDFADPSGRDLETRLVASGKSPAEALAALRFVDSREEPQCSGTTLAFTQAGSSVIHVCGRSFTERALQDRLTADIIVIHEFLHTLGLGENPPTSQEITAQVARRCGGWPSRASATESNAAIADQPSPMAPDARVRSVTPRMVAVINDATARSKTFRALVDQIGRTDGIVYVTEGRCGYGVRACLLLTMTLMGPNRVLRILVDPGKEDCDFMGSIGHELQHAVEVLSHRTIRSRSAMILLYKKEGAEKGGRFETDAAFTAGNAVRDELRESTAAAKPCAVNNQ